MQLIECELSQILIAEHQISQVIVLREKNGERVLPIEIGIVEAMAINRHVHGDEIIRPLTHDLIVSLVDNLNGELKRVIVCDLVEMQDGSGTFYGLLVIEQNDVEIEIDCRPSDAIALAVRVGCPVFVAEKLLAQA